jgi:hypothetical protein
MAGDPDQGLTELLSLGQQHQLASLLGELFDSGYGELTIIVKAGKLKFLRVVTSHAAGLPEDENVGIVNGEVDP